MQFRVSEKELDRILSKFGSIKDFNQVQKSFLSDSRNVLLFRLQLGLDRNEFSKMLGKDVNTIANLERGNKRITTDQKAKYYSDKLSYVVSLPLDVVVIKNNYRKWQLDDINGRRKRAIKYAYLGGKVSAKKLSPKKREKRAKLGGLTAKLKNAGIHNNRHLWMEWFKKGLKKSGRRTSKGPKNEKMVNELEAKVARKLFSLKIKYKYEPLFKVQDQIFYPDFVVSNNIIECCYWEHEDRWLYLANKFEKFYSSGFRCILVTKRSCKKFFSLMPDFVKIVMEENLNNLGAYLLPYGCQPFALIDNLLNNQ